jgi:hypothetical protein
MAVRAVRPASAAGPGLARPGEKESVGGERWQEVEETTDVRVPHVSEMREGKIKLSSGNIVHTNIRTPYRHDSGLKIVSKRT